MENISEEKYEEIRKELMEDAMEAEENFTLDELEAHAVRLSHGGITIIVKDEEKAKELNQIVKDLSEDDISHLRDQGD